MGRSGHPFEIFAIGGIQFAYSDFNDKNDVILLKKICLLLAPSHYRINFSTHFSVEILILNE